MSPKEDKHNFPQQIQKDSNKPLRICCYGSSSSRTQARYTNDAYNLGYTLMSRGHTCVNGAGRFGCMGALNRGAEDASKKESSSASSSLGRVVGVIHEMFIKDKADGEGGGEVVERKNDDWLEKCAPVFSTCENAEIHIAGGNDLQERKRMLVDGADALIVLPGGPGTFDEVWEMACSKQIGIIKMPIVCVNIDGYYDPFQSILERAYEDEFLYKHPNDILHFEPTSEKALEWIEKKLYGEEEKEEVVVVTTRPPLRSMTRQKSVLKRMMSVFNLPVTQSQTSSFLDEEGKVTNVHDTFMKYFVVFTAGLAFGLASTKQQQW